MSSRNAALLAFIGMLLVTALRVWNLVSAVANTVRGLVPADRLFPALLYAFGSLTLAIFFFVSYRERA